EALRKSVHRRVVEALGADGAGTGAERGKQFGGRHDVSPGSKKCAGRPAHWSKVTWCTVYHAVFAVITPKNAAKTAKTAKTRAAYNGAPHEEIRLPFRAAVRADRAGAAARAFRQPAAAGAAVAGALRGPRHARAAGAAACRRPAGVQRHPRGAGASLRRQ